MLNNNQTIGCTVASCKYHVRENNVCSLKQIIVEPCPGCSSGTAQDESMCGSYKCR